MPFEDTKPKKLRPVETVSEKYNGSATHVVREHPAFGMIGASRIQGHTQLFGSSIQHSGFIRISIHEATEEITSGSTWHHAGKIVAEVDVSETQWASFVSAMNVGFGVPCTMRYTRDGSFQSLPSIDDESFQQKRENEIGRMTKKKYEDLLKAYKALGELLNKPSVRKSDLKEVYDMFLHPVGHAESNMEFAAKLLTEHTEKLVGEGKAELEAHVTRLAHTFPGLQNIAPQIAEDAVKSIEDKS